jgi:chromosome segregation ATPase
LYFTKSRIAERSVEAHQAACVAELEEANAQLRMELDVVQSKLAEVEHRERALTSEYEDLKKDIESMHTSHDAVVREKAEVEIIERVKLQWFHDSLCKKLAKLRHYMETLVATLRGRSVEFPTGASLSDFLEWF